MILPGKNVFHHACQSASDINSAPGNGKFIFYFPARFLALCPGIGYKSGPLFDLFNLFDVFDAFDAFDAFNTFDYEAAMNWQQPQEKQEKQGDRYKRTVPISYVSCD